TPPPLPPGVAQPANPQAGQQTAATPDDNYLFFGFNPNASGGPAPGPAAQPTPPNVPPMPGPMPGGPAPRDPYAAYSYNNPQGFAPGQTFTPGYGGPQSPPNWGYYDSFGQPNPYPNQPADPYAAYGFNPYGAPQGPMTMQGPWMSPAPCFPPAYPMWSTMPAWMMLGAGMTSMFALSMMCGGWGWGCWL
ncbi:MAG: hypothetical protein KC910_25340, partial [Candidatus Eremiobacteraeota bacterium]|nr:hypothetical protein [Candidatus Eremiobacteraeota bacterium]